MDYLCPTLRQYLTGFYGSPVSSAFEYLAGANYILRECSHCRLVYQQEIPNDFLLGKLYDGWVGSSPSSDHQDPPKPQQSTIDDELLWVAAYLGRSPEKLKVLDFGMGWGDWCMGAKALGCDVYGSELSATRLAHAQALGIKTVDWVGLSDHQFDFIHTEQVFEHLAEPGATLRHLAGSLASGGLIKLSVPNGGDIHRRLAIADWKAAKGTPNSLNAVAPLEHLNCFQHQSLVVMAGQVGLAPVPLGFLPPKSLLAWVKSRLRPMLYRLRNPDLYRFLYVGTNAFFRKAGTPNR